MASNVTEECKNAELLQEKEEGEISLEDVSSSEEGHVNNYAYNPRNPQCPSCISLQHCGRWCTSSSRMCHRRGQSRRDAVQGKENWHHIKDSACTGTKHTTSTLQEKNDDLVPISSDSDMEIIGLVDNSRHIVLHSTTKSRSKGKRKKKRTHSAALQLEDLVSPSVVDSTIVDCMPPIPRDALDIKESHLPRSHHRDTSPNRRNRSRVLTRSPPRRHRSPTRGRSSFKRSRTPMGHARSPVVKRSPRRVRSPRRSPYRSPVRTAPRKVLETDQSPSHTYVDKYGNVTKLLKRVKHLDSIGVHSLQTTINRNKENASSLKEKLFNMMKELSDSNGNVTTYTKQNSSSQMKRTDDVDDEEDLALLRQQALETKQKKSSKLAEPRKNKSEKKATKNDDDQDDEDMMRLRIIALRSAVLKKHQNRVRKGMKTGMNRKPSASRSESPFSQSFLDSIPIPDEEHGSCSSPSYSPCSNGNNGTEDLEKLPYSPTDKITSSIPIDTELLGIQSSDVSFIPFTDVNATLAFGNAHMQVKQDSSQSGDPGIQLCTETLSANIPYSPSDPVETSNYTEMRKVQTLISVPLIPNISSNLPLIPQDCKSTSTSSDINSTPDVPYSPTDTPLFDPDLSQTVSRLKNTCTFAGTNESQRLLDSTYVNDSCDDVGQQNNTFVHLQLKQLKESDNVQGASSTNETDSTSLAPCVGSAPASSNASTSPNSSMVTIDDLTETDADTTPPVSGTKNLSIIPSIPEYLSSEIANMAKEPFYMQAVPDVTKDSNRIPTLITRTLVPVPILKSNKQLQQPLPARKQENHVEPAFKSAQMQPVTVDPTLNLNKSSTLFKPIKLIPVAKKTQAVLPMPMAFNNCLNDDQESDACENQNTSLMGTRSRSPPTLRSNNTIPQYKRKKRSKKSTKWKNANALVIINKNNQPTGKIDNLETKATPCTSNLENLSQSMNVASLNDALKNDEKLQVKSSEKRETRDKAVTERKALNDVHHNNNNNNNNNTKTERNDTVVLTVKTTKGTAQDADQTKETEKRRQSVDEDEESLRAILLASLAKRSKPLDVANNTATLGTKKPAIIESKTAAPPKLPTKPVTTRIGTITTTSAEVTLSHLRESLNVNTSGLEKTLSSNTALTSGLVTSFQTRKRHLPIVKGPSRKITRKVSIPASTKVVNNAKKYQNTIVQRRLNQQKVANRYNIHKITENGRMCNTTNNEKKWTAPSKSLIVPETQRIVINLESDTESDSESEKRKSETPLTSNSASPTNRPPLMIPTTEFEKSVDQFLREARKKQESVAAKPSAMPNVALASQCLTKKSISPIMSIESKDPSLRTPLAVRHLPASQQEEYRRLKQQILEHEKLKLRRTAENTLAKQKIQTTAATSVPNQTGTSSTETQLNSTKSLKDINLTTIKSIHTSTPKPVNAEKIADKVVDAREPKTKQISPAYVESNETKKTMTNLSVRISNETVYFSNTAHARTPTTSTNRRTVPQRILSNSTVPLDEANRSSAGLKILTKDELNRKFVQVHIDQDSKRRVVTINDSVMPSRKTQENKISENDTNTDIITHGAGINNVARVQGSETIPDDEAGDKVDAMIDSDASTQLLSPVSQSIRSVDTLDTTGSTLTLSQYEAAKDECLHEANNDDNCDFTSDMILSNRHSIMNNWETIRQDTKTELNILINLPEEEQKHQLTNTEKKLVKKRYTILNDLAKMVGTLQQWDMERDFQTCLVAEVKKLREQLKVAEKKLQEQRNLIKNMGPKVMTAHKKINDGRRECCKLLKICSVLGTKVEGEGYTVPDAGAQLLIDGLKDVANHTRQLSKKKVPSLDLPDICIRPSSAECLPSQTVRTEAIQTDESLIQTDDNSTTSTVTKENECEDCSSLTVDIANTLQLSATTDDETPVESNRKRDKQSDSSKKSDIDEHNETATDATPQLSDTNATKCGDRDDHTLCREKQESVKNSVPAADSSPEDCTKQDVERQPKKIIEPYVSILKHLEVPRNMNPNGVLCPYELMGTCNDADCQFIHQSKHVQ